MKRYVVLVKNEILGNSTHLMTMEEIKNFNLCAYQLARKAENDNMDHTDGMWTVYPYVNSCGLKE